MTHALPVSPRTALLSCNEEMPCNFAVIHKKRAVCYVCPLNPAYCLSEAPALCVPLQAHNTVAEALAKEQAQLHMSIHRECMSSPDFPVADVWEVAYFMDACCDDGDEEYHGIMLPCDGDSPNEPVEDFDLHAEY